MATERKTSALEEQIEALKAELRRREEEDIARIEQDLKTDLSSALVAAHECAQRENARDIADVLNFLVGACLFDRERALEHVATVARKAEKTHPGLLGKKAPPDWTRETTRILTSPGPPPGVPVRWLAQRVHRFLTQWNYPEQSDLRVRHESDYFDTPIGLTTIELEAIVEAIPSRLIVGDRIYISSNVPHRDGASPRKGEKLCRCATCEADRILSAVERVMKPLKFPRPRKNAK